MSRPARDWSETTTACASENCSRNHGSIMAVSRGRPHMFIVYQRGRGHEPVTVAGSIRSFVAVNAIGSLTLRVSGVHGLISEVTQAGKWKKCHRSIERLINVVAVRAARRIEGVGRIETVVGGDKRRAVEAARGLTHVRQKIPRAGARKAEEIIAADGGELAPGSNRALALGA